MNKAQSLQNVVEAGGAGEARLERLLFNNRLLVLIVFSFVTLFLAYQVMSLRPDASFEKMIPLQHPYIQKMMEHREDLGSGANAIQIAVEAKEGDIFTEDFVQILQEISDEIFYLPGVDRTAMKSLWTANVRWVAVTEDGYDGGRVIPATYNGSEETLQQLRKNILRSGEVGRLVANNFKSTIVYAPLLDTNPETGEPINYQEFSHKLEERIRERFSSDKVEIHIVGFAKKVGDLLDGIASIGIFALITLAITAILLFYYSRCIRSSIAPLVCSIVAVVWQLGLLTIFGYGLDAYSVLVPFLVFAIGVSHGVQLINAVGHEAAKGSNSEQASRIAFRHLYIAGITALVSDAVGFLTLLIIDIQVIQDLAVAASLGVAVIIVTNLALLPIIMSYVGVGKGCIEKKQREENEAKKGRLWELLSSCATPRGAAVFVGLAIVLFAFGVHQSQGLKIGDLDKGAPELRPNSRYNLDNIFVVDNYSTSSDIMVVMAETPAETCVNYPALDAIDRFEWTMQNVPGVQSTVSVAQVAKQVVIGMNEGNLKYGGLPRSQSLINTAVNSPNMPLGLYNGDCTLVPIMIFLDDHKAETLERVVAKVEAFAARNDSELISFKLAAGNAGIEAATNQVIEKAQIEMLILVYGVVSVLVLLTFRSLATVVCIIVPLALTSLLCQVLMAYMGIGVKVATLPVIALGVGVGVDYGIYIYSRLQSYLAMGLSLQEAYRHTLMTTGKAVAFTGVTLAIGVGTWIMSPIKFQADMGILLTFMFLWNMLGALVLLPALANYFLKVDKQENELATAGGVTADTL